MGIPNGIGALGYGSEDIDDLIKGAMPQQRVLSISPLPATEELLGEIYEESITNY